MSAPPIAALRSLLDAPTAAPAPAACELCSQPLGEPHEHLLDLNTRQLACACTACALLFETGPTSSKMPAFKRLPRDSHFLPNLDLSGQEWASLAIPIGLAFLTLDSRSGAVTAAYPSPAGVVTAAIDPEAWSALSAAHAELHRLTPDIEALLLDRLSVPHQSFLVPLDAAFRLAGLIRAHWSGFTGGAELRRILDRFLAELRHA